MKDARALEHEIRFLQRHSQAIACTNLPGILVKNVYYDMKVPGSLPVMYLREAVVLRLQEAQRQLPSGYQLLLLDGFRPLSTQKSLVQFYLQEAIKALGSHEEAYRLMATYFTDPDALPAGQIPPHLSGGAVDLTLVKDGEEVAMGSAFDAMTPASATAYFDGPQTEPQISPERCQHYRWHRQLLKNTLLSVGFTNYEEEWWHYDLGTRFWSQIKGTHWQYDELILPVSCGEMPGRRT